MLVRQLQGQYPLLRRLFCEHQSHARLIADSAAVGGVVHLKDQVGVRGDEFRHALREAFGRAAGSIHQKQVARGRVCFVHQMRIAQA